MRPDSNNFLRYVISKAFLGNITSLMFVLLCFAYPISAISSLLVGLPPTIVNVSYRAVVLFIALYVILISSLLHRISIRKCVVPLIFFLIFYLVRVFWDTIVLQVKTFHTLIEIYSFFLGGIFFPIIAIILAFKYISPKKVYFQIFCVLAGTNCLMLYYFLSQKGFALSPDMLLFRAEITGADEEVSVLNPISFGLYGGYLMLLCLWSLLIIKDSFSKIIIKLLYFLFFIGLINLILSTSRGPFLFTIIGIAFVMLIHFSKVKFNVQYWLKLLSICFGIIVFFVFVFQYLNKEGIDIGVFDRVFSTVENMQSGEKEERNYFFAEAITMFYNSPVIGDRVVLRSTGGFPHNAILEVLMATGVIGFILYFLILVSLILNFISFKSYSEYYSLIMGLFILSLGMSFTSGNLYQNIDNWNLIAVLLCWPKKVNKIV